MRQASFFGTGLTIRALRAGDFIDSRAVRIVQTCSRPRDRIALQPGSYGSDTSKGQLSAIDDLLAGPRCDDLETSPRSEWQRRNVSSVLAQFPKTKRKTATGIPAIGWQPIDAVPSGWWDVLETCLGLTTLRSRGLSWSELVSVVRTGLSIEELTGARRAAQNLCAEWLHPGPLQPEVPGSRLCWTSSCHRRHG